MDTVSFDSVPAKNSAIKLVIQKPRAKGEA